MFHKREYCLNAKCTTYAQKKYLFFCYLSILYFIVSRFHLLKCVMSRENHLVSISCAVT